MPRPAIAEENLDFCENLRHLLGLDPDFFCVCTCRSPENALSRLGAATPDIVVTEIEFPGGSGGLSCATGLCRLLPALKILVFTAHHDSDRIPMWKAPRRLPPGGRAEVPERRLPRAP